MDIEALPKSAGADSPVNFQKQLIKAIKGTDANDMHLSNIQAHAVVIRADGKTKKHKREKDENNKIKTKKHNQPVTEISSKHQTQM